MKNEFIPYEQAVALKELGFDEPCMGYRAEGADVMIKETPHCVISAPTFSQAFRWFREKYMLFGDVGIYGFDIIDLDKKEEIFISEVDVKTTYEEAELECLKKLIEIAKNK